MLLCEIDYILKQHKMILVEFRISILLAFGTYLKQGSLR